MNFAEKGTFPAGRPAPRPEQRPLSEPSAAAEPARIPLPWQGACAYQPRPAEPPSETPALQVGRRPAFANAYVGPSAGKRLQAALQIAH